LADLEHRHGNGQGKTDDIGLETNKQKCPYGSYTEMTREGRRMIPCTWTSRWTSTDQWVENFGGHSDL